jgi:hypothetical protein
MNVQAREAPAASRRANLQKAQQSRVERAVIKSMITAGELTVPDAIREPCMASMSVFDLLRCQHYWGPTHVKRVLSQLQISPLRTVRELTERQRELLAAACVERGRP